MRGRLLSVIVALLVLLTPGYAKATASEIVELARALKNNPDSIYQYVYNNIKTLPQYGSLKGPVGALIDGQGTAFDQAELMGQLLAQAGYTPTYHFGLISLTAAQLTNWLGLDNSPNSVSVVIGSGGFPGTDTIVSGVVTSTTVGWAWVSTTIGGTEYFFDPATKNYSVSSGLSNLASALGYSQSTFTSHALSGSSSAFATLTGLNRTNIRSDLASLAGNLISYIKTNIPTASPTDVLGGRTIQQIPANTQLRQTSLSYATGTITNSATIPDSYRTFLIVGLGQAVGSSQGPMTFRTSDIYGHRLSVFWNSPSQPALFLDGVQLMTGITAFSPPRGLVVVQTQHPYPNQVASGSPCLPGYTQTFADQCYFFFPFSAFPHVIAQSWGPVSRAMVERQRKQLGYDLAAQSPSPNYNSEPILGGGLQLLAMNWAAEMDTLSAIANRFFNVSLIVHHRVGFAGIRPVSPNVGPFVDLPLNKTNPMQLVSRPSGGTSLTPLESSAHMATSSGGSALESGVIKQTQPGYTAVSTAFILDSQEPNPIFDINNSAISGDDASYYNSTIRPQISPYYSSADLGIIDSAVSAGYRVIATNYGGNVYDQWVGTGYYKLSPSLDYIGAFITGGLSGGHITTAETYPNLVDNTSIQQSPSSQSAVNTVLGVTRGGSFMTMPAGGDPVNLVTGDYLYQHEDLSIGSGKEFPYRLGFQRSYDSGKQVTNGPLGWGWTHNFAITALQDSDGFEGFGENSPINAAAAIAALYVTKDILNTGGTIPLDRILMAASANQWMMEQLTNNVVKVTQAGKIEQFTKLPDGTYNPPLGSGSTLTGSSGSYVYKTKDQTALTFDSVGNLATWHHPSGPTVTLTYDSGTHQLVTVSNGMGRSYNFTYSGARITSVTDPVSGHSQVYTYDSAGNLATARDANLNTTTYQYIPGGLPGLLYKIFYPSKPTNAFVTNAYDNLARIKTQTDANGNTTNLYFTGPQSEVDAPNGDANFYFFTPRGKLWAEVDPLWNITYHVYDGLDRLTQTAFPEGNSTYFFYDSKSNPTAQAKTPKPGSSLPSLVDYFTYDATYNKPTSAADPNGNTTYFVYGSTTGNLTDIYQPTVGGFTPHEVRTYNSRGQVLTITDPMGKVTANTYDSSTEALLTSTEDSGHLNLLTQYTYNNLGDLNTVTDPNGNVTTVWVDSMRRVTQVVGPSSTGALTNYIYDADGNLLQTQRQISTGVYETTQKSYTPSFKVNTETDAAGNVTTHYYDQKDRRWATVDPETRTTVFGHDPLDRDTSVWNWDIQSSAPLVAYTFTANGKRASLTDANNHTTTYAYDGHDRLSTVTYPNSSTETFTYDLNGNMLVETTRGALTITNTYDALNRLSTHAPQSQPTVTTTYDLVGRPLTVSDSAGTFTYAYDTAGRNSSITRPDSKVVGFQYDANGNRTRVTWPDSYYATYTYDALNRLTEVKENGATSLAIYTYDPLSRRTGITYGNGATAAYTYGSNSDIATVAHSFNGSAVTFTYASNTAHQRGAVTVSDASYLWHPPAAISWLAYTPNNVNQYTSIGGVTITNSTAGNLTGDGTYSFTYDTENRLTGASKTGTTASYAFDPLSRRKSKTVNSTTTSYLSEGDREIAEYDNSGNFLRRLVYGPNLDEPIVVIDSSSNKSYVHTDGLGSVVALTNGSGTVTDKYTYSPFGETATLTGTARFTGRRIDAETGLYHYRARAYAPALGRFLQPDPIGYDGGINLYEYVKNDPLNLTDPMGTCVGPLAALCAFEGFEALTAATGLTTLSADTTSVALGTVARGSIADLLAANPLAGTVARVSIASPDEALWAQQLQIASLHANALEPELAATTIWQKAAVVTQGALAFLGIMTCGDEAGCGELPVSELFSVQPLSSIRPQYAPARKDISLSTLLNSSLLK